MRRLMLFSVVLLCVFPALARCDTAAASGQGPASDQPSSSSGQLWKPRRSLQQQQDALSNSNGCITSGAIPKCEPGACATRNVMGVVTWVCLRCLSNYEPVVDSSGQDNILQCVCPRGSYEEAANATRCSRCDRNAFCPGGDKNPNPSSRGSIAQCGAGLVTRTTGARSQVDCVAQAGYAKSSPTSGTPCSPSTYAPAFNHLGQCLKCQSGLQEPPGSGLTDGQRDTKREVCKVPPGRYMSHGLVRVCAQGFYREFFLDFDHPNATLCLPCNPGITTDGPGAGSPALCNKVLPGHGISTVDDLSQGAPLPALPPGAEEQGLPPASLCELGFYSTDGFCVRCPSETVTRAKGSTGIEACVVPPGYFTTPASMALCPPGTYRKAWLMHSDPRASTCTACGVGIGSEARELDENPMATNGSLVRATAASCYIEAGQGMIVAGSNTFTARDCPANSFGVAGRMYGLGAAPCKPCPRNMVTDQLSNANRADACINPDGFGYASEGTSRCAPGFYALRGSRKPCEQCGACRTTLDNPAAQRLITDCFISPGCGVVQSGAANGSDTFSPNTDGLTPTELAQLPAMECPAGWWGAGNAPAAMCQRCPVGSSTQGPGSMLMSQCNVCVPGYGLASATATSCELCTYGSYQPDFLWTECKACQNATFYAPVDGLGPAWTSPSTTLFTGAWHISACVPVQSQLSPEAGQAYFRPGSAIEPLLSSSPAASLGVCLAACGPNTCCLAQWDANAQSCKTVTLAAANGSAEAPAGLQLHYKLPPSTMVAASSTPNQSPDGAQTTAKMLASGFYAICTVPKAASAAWESVGSDLTPDARTFASGAAVWDPSTDGAASCRRRCDASNVCFGFVFNVATGGCLYRGGVDALNSRSFFVHPGGPIAAIAGDGPATDPGSLPLPEEGDLPDPEEGDLPPPQDGDLPAPVITCSAPSPPDNGVLGGSCAGAGPYAVGVDCPVTCANGFTASAASLTCGGDGSWSPATCTAVTCNTPTAPANGALGGSCAGAGPYAVGAQCAVTCANGFAASDAQLTCGGDGSWSPATCTAVPVTCSTPSTPANGALGGSCAGAGPYAVGAQCSVTCATGFTASAASLTCGGDGSWSSATCTAVTCNTPTAPANGATNCAGAGPYAVGAECPVTCANGFTASAASLTCGGDGSWSTATCTECPTCCAADSYFIQDVVPVAAFGPNPGGAHPQGLTTDAAGNLIWAEYDSNCVRRWDVNVPATAAAAQGMTVLAGICGANPDNSGLDKPTDVVLDSSGNVYIADERNNGRIRVRLATSASPTALSTVTISGLSQPLQRPNGLAIHPTTGALIVADRSRVISLAMKSPTQGTATVIYSGDNGDQLHGLAFSPSGDLFVAADGDRRVFMLRVSDGTVVLVAGGGNGGNMGPNNNGDGGPATNARLDGAKDVALMADGSLIIPSGQFVRRVDMSTGLISTVVGPVERNRADQVRQPAPSGTRAIWSTAMAAWGAAVDSRGVAYFIERDAPRLRRLSCT